MNVNHRIVLPAAAVAAALASAAVAAPPTRYVMQTLDPLSTPSAHRGTPARILAFDAAGNGYGYSLTGQTGSPIAAVRWEQGQLIPLSTPSGTTSSHAAAVNGAGDAVGWFTATGDQGGAVWRDGVAHPLGELLPLGINSAGTIAGVVRNPAAPRRHAPAIWRHGNVSLLPMANPAAHGWVAGVSASGEVAGSWYAGLADHRAVRWVGGEAQVLPLPAGTDRSEAHAVNGAGWIVGAAYREGSADNAAVLWRGDEAIDLGVLDAATPSAWAHSINNLNQVVGFAETSTGPTAFLWQDGVMHDLRSLIDSGPEALDAAYLVIGDTGHISGVQFLSDGTARAFVLTPVPGPGGFVVLAGFAQGLRRRR